MSNQNLNTLNVKTLNYTGNHIYHRGQRVTTIPVDASNNQCMTDPLGIGICYGDAITDGSGFEVRMLGDLNVNSKIQIAIDPANKEPYHPPGDGVIGGEDHQPGQIIFTRDASGHYTFFGYEQTDGGTWGWHAFSTSTSTLSNIWNSAGDGTIWYNDQDTKVGINTNSPTETLDVSGNTRLRGELVDEDGMHGPSGNILQATDTGINWIHPQDASGVWSEGAGNIIYYSKGSVGIGTDTPSTLLDVTGGDALIHDLTVGRGGGSLISNSAIGYHALYSNTSSRYNTAIGNQALYSLTGIPPGWYNTACGYQALYSNTGGSNTASGYEALYTNTTGGSNTANGFQTLYYNTIGNKNTANGSYALWSNADGSGNTAVGYQALFQNTDGSNNTAIGYQAGFGQDKSFYNTINIGYNTSCNAHNTAVIGNSDCSAVYFGSTSAAANIRCKSIIDENALIGPSGNILQATATGIKWIHPQDASGVWSEGNATGQIYYSKGDVGIGTNTPLQTLDVSGNTRLRGDLFDATDSSGAIGDILQSTALGTEWVSPFVPISAHLPVGTIVMWPGHNAPPHWILCDGLSYIPADFSTLLQTVLQNMGLIGFVVPNFQGRFPAMAGNPSEVGPPVGTYIGQMPVVTDNSGILINQMPTHTHNVPIKHAFGASGSDCGVVEKDGLGDTCDFPSDQTGNSQSYAPPYISINFIIYGGEP